MSISKIKSFAKKTVEDSQLAEQLKGCERVKELVDLAKQNGFDFAEEELYPPNEPGFTAEQLHPKLVKVLLR
ncbi:Nif11-like leader peptide family natural product precursor [Aerosakkonema funiforme]|uniref:Nif11-like leader peptide family natural product precursor n=1 Tax=Aerosakkonema funiforme TaxID=1246630 RepID=UPI0035BA3B3F